ncbi:MAG: FHA domain-containing protein [Planctomycetales bacterium]|nr:FHA domain-containing protein [Planctomycetales bacterium]
MTAISGTREGETFTVHANQCVTFGRTHASDTSFEGDLHMSGTHFQIENLGDEAMLTDRGSTNGTWLNTERISKERLREGDRIRAGTAVFTVEFVRDSVDRGMPPPIREDFGVGGPPQVGGWPSSTPRDDEPKPFANAAFDSAAYPPRSDRQSPLADSTPYAKSPFANKSSDGNSTSGNSLSPFSDSMDFEESEPVKPTPAFNFKPSPKPMAPDNPFADSSLYNQVPESIKALGRPKVEDRRAHKRFQLLQRLTVADAADSMGIVLDSLTRKWSVQLVLHFQKIRNGLPSGLPSAKALFSWLPMEAVNCSPVRVAWADVCRSATVLPMLPRLCRADGCIAFLGKDAADIARQIDAMGAMGVEGFSEQDGFLPIYWPSSFAAMIDCRGQEMCSQLFGNAISGVILCSAWHQSRVVACADEELTVDLQIGEFRPSSRIIG